MKEFEKWVDKSYVYIDSSCQGMARAGWKAALEWLLSQPDGSCGVRRCVPMEAIRDELNSK